MMTVGRMAVLCALAVMWGGSTGCISGNDSAVADVSPNGWDTPVEMSYNNRDTVSERKPVLFLRHDNRTRKGRYAVEFRTTAGGVVRTDTVSVDTSETYDPAISIAPTITMNPKLSYRERIRLTEEGEYIITVTPLQNTTGVWSIGINFNEAESGGQR